MSAKDVDITLNNGTLQANPESVSLSKSQGHSVLWHNNTGKDVLIKFDTDTPFDRHVHPYHIGAGQKKPSGNIVADAGTTWSYTISFEGGPAMDPQVIIDR